MPLISCEWSILLLFSQQRSNRCLSASNDCVLQAHSGWQVSDGETKLLLWPDGGGWKAGEGKTSAAPYPAMCHYLSPEPWIFPLSHGQVMAKPVLAVLKLVLPSKWSWNHFDQSDNEMHLINRSIILDSAPFITGDLVHCPICLVPSPLGWCLSCCQLLYAQIFFQTDPLPSLLTSPGLCSVVFLLFLHLSHSESHPIWLHLDWESHSPIKQEAESDRLWVSSSRVTGAAESRGEDSPRVGWTLIPAGPDKVWTPDQSTRTQVVISPLCVITLDGAPGASRGLGGDQG